MIVFSCLKPFSSLHMVFVSPRLPRALQGPVPDVLGRRLTSGAWHEPWAGPLAGVLWERHRDIGMELSSQGTET